MSSYVISCCSTADLTEEHFSKREISYICFHYKLNDTEYADDLASPCRSISFMPPWPPALPQKHPR